MFDLSCIILSGIFFALLITLIIHLYKNWDTYVAYSSPPKHTRGRAVSEALYEHRIAFEKLIAEKKKCPVCYQKTLKINDCEGPPNCTRSMKLYDKSVRAKKK